MSSTTDTTSAAIADAIGRLEQATAELTRALHAHGILAPTEPPAPTTDYDRAITYAEQLGADHGRARASWYFDGNTSDDTYRRVLRGLEDGDPEILDTFPAPPLSGEYAGAPTPASILSEITAGADLEAIWNDDDDDDVLRAYEDAFDIGASREIERAARIMLGLDTSDDRRVV